MEGLKKAVALLQEQEQMAEMLKRLKKMQGRVMPDKRAPGQPKCSRITFDSDYGAQVQSPSKGDSAISDLNVLLVDTAVVFLTAKLETLNVLAGLADMAIEKALEQPNKDK